MASNQPVLSLAHMSDLNYPQTFVSRYFSHRFEINTISRSKLGHHFDILQFFPLYYFFVLGRDAGVQDTTIRLSTFSVGVLSNLPNIIHILYVKQLSI